MLQLKSPTGNGGAFFMAQKIDCFSSLKKSFM